MADRTMSLRRRSASGARPSGKASARVALVGDLQADRTHQLEGVAARHHPGLQPVVENQRALLEPVVEMVVGGATKDAWNPGEGQGMGTDDADGIALS